MGHADGVLLTPLGLKRLQHLFRGNRQVQDPNPHRVVNRVGDGPGHRYVAVLPNSLGLIRSLPRRGFQQPSLQFRNVRHGGNLVVAQAQGGNLPLFTDDFLHQRIAQPLN